MKTSLQNLFKKTPPPTQPQADPLLRSNPLYETTSPQLPSPVEQALKPRTKPTIETTKD